MSQITRCPSCATSFRVVADQLRISEGWVRCGQCKEVFDASAHLVPIVALSNAPDLALPSVPEPPPTEAVYRGIQTKGVALDGRSEEGTAFVRAPSSPEYPGPVSVSLALDETHTLSADGVPSTVEPGRGLAQEPADQTPRASDGRSEVRPESVLAPWLRGRADTPAVGDNQKSVFLQGPVTAELAAVVPVISTMPEHTEPSSLSLPLSVGQSLSLAHDTLVSASELQDPSSLQKEDGSLGHAADLPAPDSVGSHVLPAIIRSEHLKAPTSLTDDGDLEDNDSLNPSPEVGFVVAARHKALWRKPVVRAMLSLLLLLSISVLVLQVAVHERDQIAAMDARAKPFLMSLCDVLGCDIAPQRKIAQVVIDSSSFNKARGDSYQLIFVMQNRADVPVAMPAMELTLTDAQDQPVLRKVLLPEDLAAPLELAARGQWDASVSVVVTTGGARVAGYRLLAFYP